MITEQPHSENNNLNRKEGENQNETPENQEQNPTQNNSDQKIFEEKDEVEKSAESSDQEENCEEIQQKAEEIPASSEIKKETEETHEQNYEEEESERKLTLQETLLALEKIINSADAGKQYKKFNQLKDHAFQIIHEEVDEKKQDYLEQEGHEEENFSFEHPSQSKLSGLIHIFKEKQDDYHKNQEQEQEKNLEIRHEIVNRLKNLYTNAEPGTNLFKEIREIKQDWSNAGQVPKSEFRIINNDYFYHLNQFYAMLDLNKEYMQQEYEHNLEKRQHIIERAKELVNEPSVQKALNELQYLHKLWKEEAVPVAEEHREPTWEEFKEVSNQIHERKNELSAQIEEEQKANLEKKNIIIEAISKLTHPEKEPNHNYWQNSIKKVEQLRSDFLKLGSVPRKISNQNWTEFKETLRNFNSAKNDFYKNLKNAQQDNLEAKLKLIETAKDNMHAEDWETLVPLYKKLQQDWKKIGHVPRSQANKIWEEFREYCNTFFNNYRDKNAAAGDDWKENFKNKKEILDQLKEVGDGDGSIEKIEELKTAWNNIGKVPRDKMSINSEFNKTLRDKLKLNNVTQYELREEGLSEGQLTDKARKIKSQISDLEAEIAKLETNLAFFNNPSRENPLLKDTFDRIDEKKSHLENMKQNLHEIISGE